MLRHVGPMIEGEGPRSSARVTKKAVCGPGDCGGRPEARSEVWVRVGVELGVRGKECGRAGDLAYASWEHEGWAVGLSEGGHAGGAHLGVDLLPVGDTIQRVLEEAERPVPQEERQPEPGSRPLPRDPQFTPRVSACPSPAACTQPLCTLLTRCERSAAFYSPWVRERPCPRGSRSASPWLSFPPL